VVRGGGGRGGRVTRGFWHRRWWGLGRVWVRIAGWPVGGDIRFEVGITAWGARRIWRIGRICRPAVSVTGHCITQRATGNTKRLSVDAHRPVVTL
jgi:hypothetical protein